MALRKHSADFVKAGSGLDEDGKWTPVFPGQRPPFPPGVSVQETHGAYVAPLRLGERPAEIADALRPLVPGYSAGVEPLLLLYAQTLTRCERAAAALDRVEQGLEDAERLRRREDDLLLNLRQDLRAWIRLSVRLAGELGLSPSSSARIMKDVGIGASAAAQHAELLERYRGAA